MSDRFLQLPIKNKFVTSKSNGKTVIASCEVQNCRKQMEDIVVSTLSLSKKHPDVAFIGVFDGHSGNECSRYISKRIPELLGGRENPFDKHTLIDVCRLVDHEISSKPFKDQGSTACFCLLKDTSLTVVNVGDSRCYVFDTRGIIKYNTIDHKPEDSDEYDRIRHNGGFVTNNRVNGCLAMSRSFGDFHYKSKTNPLVICDPTIDNITIQKGDRILLFSDGFTEVGTGESLVDFVHKSYLSNETTLINACDKAMRMRGTDNLSIIIATPFHGTIPSYCKTQYILGPYNHSDSAYRNAYLKNAKHYNIDGEILSYILQRRCNIEGTIIE